MTQPMTYPDLPSFLSSGSSTLEKGPIGLIFVEDDVEVAKTITHHRDLGFKTLVVFAPPEIPQCDQDAIWVCYDTVADNAVENAVNAVIAAAPGQWLYYCFNAEFLHFPFCETRKVGEMLSFNSEERRETVLSYVIDLYAGDLTAHPNAVALDDAYLDCSGYYALARWNGKGYEERQLDFFGGLRWRYEEHVPWMRRRIDRVSLFRARPGLELRSDHTFNLPEFNTYACPWHHNLTATICSFRTAKALKRNPGSAKEITDFRWRASEPFTWSSKQLMDMGLMEPGQWF